jgi:DNA helicase IV
LPEGLLGQGDDRLDATASVLTVQQAKGLEFDAVFVVEPDLIAAEGARRGTDLYVALTRATRSLTITYCGTYPKSLAEDAQPATASSTH